MNLHPLVTFAIDNPWLTLGLSFPVSFILISISWMVATNIETALRLVYALISQFANLATVWVKGYPPPATPPVVAPLKDEDE